MKILNVVGTRPNFVKIAPLIREMREHPEIEPLLLHTGQHYDEQLFHVFFRQMGIPRPDVDLQVGSGSHAWQTGEILRRIEPVLLEQRPDLLLVVGDVNSTIAAALAAAKLGIPVAHVEAGLRSFDRSMPEEINRVLTDALADFLFVTEEDAVDNLLKEGKAIEQIHFVGNVMIDALRQSLPLAERSELPRELGLIQDGEVLPFALLTLHRPSNVDAPGTLQSLLQAVAQIAQHIPVIFPTHPRTLQRLETANNGYHDSIRFISPAGYLDFLWLMSHARLVLTDSGGVQEETTALGVPCLTLRENTERPVTVQQGTNEIVGTDPHKIVSAATRALANGKKHGRVPPLWDGRASQRIVNIILKQVPEPPLPLSATPQL
jgi:UDP-N-acetylglucosamine 2-epimerase (non-hydrolysing)